MRMAEWSPECVRCQWIGGATATRRRRPLPRHEPQRPAPMEHHIDHRGDASRGAVRLGGHLLRTARRPLGVPHRAARRGCSAGRDRCEDRRGSLLRAVSPFITGSPDRAKRNADTMESTLQAIKAAAEATSRTPAGRNRPVQGACQRRRLTARQTSRPATTVASDACRDGRRRDELAPPDRGPRLRPEPSAVHRDLRCPARCGARTP